MSLVDQNNSVKGWGTKELIKGRGSFTKVYTTFGSLVKNGDEFVSDKQSLTGNNNHMFCYKSFIRKDRVRVDERTQRVLRKEESEVRGR